METSRSFYTGKGDEVIRVILGDIIDVEIHNLDINNDDRGILYESYRQDEVKLVDSVRQIYIVSNHDEVVRAYHKHRELIDVFTLVKGYAKFILIDDREGSKSFNNYQIVNLCDKKPQTLIVPCGVYHGWLGSKDCILVSAANRMYKGVHREGQIDEVRIPWDSMGVDVWHTVFK